MLPQANLSSDVKRVLYLLFALLGCSSKLSAQLLIVNADGSAFSTRYCYANKSYEIKGQPDGGVFSGCGISLQNGQWVLNPVTATAGITVFPYQCSISYTVNNQTLNRTILIYKPVRTEPPLQDSATCNGMFNLKAQTLYAGSYNYAWTPAAALERPDSNITSGLITQTTTFVLTTTDLTTGCKAQDSVTITRNPVPEVMIQPAEITIRVREQIQLQASGAKTYRWIPSRWLNNASAADPIVSPEMSASYMVIGTNEYGCVDSAMATVHVDERIFLPDAFTPNGDGRNDVFRINNFGYIGVQVFNIYNRWGQKIYETNDGTRGWDGTYNGKPADVGTYYYHIRLAMRDGTVTVLKGEVVLVR